MMNRIYSVGQINTYIKNMFAQDFLLKKVSIKGELSNCKYYGSGHIYFSLKDDTGSISGVMFKGNRIQGLKVRIQNGDNVVVTGTVQVYERDGCYQINAREIKLDGTGALFLRFEALKKELAEMGMFAPEYKKPIPKYIRRLGVVTSPVGAAVQDIRNTSHRRNPYVQLILYPAQVQGDGAAESIVNGIRALERLGADAIIVGRGGGSYEDLWAFNEEIVAQAIFACSVPIISAVGHETDTTIADYVADLRAATPTAAAELAVYDYKQFREGVRMIYSTLNFRMREHIRMERQRQEQLKVRLGYLSPQAVLDSRKQRLADLEEKLQNRMESRLESTRHQIQILAGQLETGSPVRKLSQGFSFVTDGYGHPLRQISQVGAGDVIEVRVTDGKIWAKVMDVARTADEIGSDK